MQATRHFMLDAYDCNFEQANSILVVNNLLVTLANRLEMKPVMPPFLIPYYYCEDAEDGGISAFIICENGSHITVHTFPYRYCYFVDILTDKFFMESDAVELVGQQIHAKVLNPSVCDRRLCKKREESIDCGVDFGPHYMITINNIDASMEKIAKWLDNVAPKINMTPISRPYVIFDRVIDPEYISGVLVVAQSHIAFHYSLQEKMANIDIFSCSFLEDGIVENILEESFGDEIQIQLIARGSKHKHNLSYSEKYNNSIKNHKNWQENI